MSAQTPERSATAQQTAAELEAEVRDLRKRLVALEAELVEVQAQTNETVAHWQERAYWLERWQLDLNRLMRRRGAMQALALLKLVRSGVRMMKRMKWRLFS